MTWTVRIEWSDRSVQTYPGLTRAEAQALADITTKTYAYAKVTLEQVGR